MTSTLWRPPRGGWLPWLVLVAIAVRLVLFTGIQGTDELVYAERAFALLHGHASEGWDLFAARIGYVAPLALVLGIGGINQASLALLTMASSTILVILAWKFGVRLRDETFAAVAALMVAVLPLDIVYASDGHGDLPLGMAATAAMYCLWTSGLEPERARSLRLALWAGLLFGLAHLIKETAFILFMPALWWLTDRRYWRQLLVTGTAFAAVIGTEAVTYALATGDPLARIHLARSQVEAIRVQNGGEFWARAADLVLSPLSPLGDAFIFVGALAWLTVAGMIWVAVSERRSIWIVVWVVTVVVAIGFWPLTVAPYRPALALNPRFFTALIVPGALLGARALILLWTWRPIGWIATAGTVALGLLCAVVNHQEAIRWRAGAEWAHAALVENRARVVTDARTKAQLLFLAAYRPSYDVSSYEPFDASPDAGTLLLDNQRLAAAVAAWDGRPPPEWWRDASSVPRTVVAETGIPGRISLRGRISQPDLVILGRVTP